MKNSKQCTETPPSKREKNFCLVCRFLFKECNGKEKSKIVLEEPPHCCLAGTRLSTLEISCIDHMGPDMIYGKHHVFASVTFFQTPLTPAFSGDVDQIAQIKSFQKVSLGHHKNKQSYQKQEKSEKLPQENLKKKCPVYIRYYILEALEENSGTRADQTRIQRKGFNEMDTKHT